jgi:hypothetical protein
MGWDITARTHTEIQLAIQQTLQDLSNSKWEKTELNQYIKDGLRELSKYVPYEVKDTSLTTTASDKTLDLSSIKDILWIKRLEYKVDKATREFKRFEWLDANTIRMDINFNPGSGDSVYLYLAKKHHLDPVWTASKAYVKGDFISPTKANRNGYRYECTTAGTAHSATEPTWGTTVGNTTSDESPLVWTCRGELPNSLQTPKTQLEDVFIKLIVARALINKAPKHINKINVGSARAMEQYVAMGGGVNEPIALRELRGMSEPRMRQSIYPTS